MWSSLIWTPSSLWGAAAKRPQRALLYQHLPVEKARAPPRKPYETLCIGRSSDRLFGPPPAVQLWAAYFRLSPHQVTEASGARFKPFLGALWPDLFTGVDIYPMLIVFRAETAACLKHSSLFKVNIVVNFWAPPLPCRSGPGDGGLPPRRVTPKLS